MERTFGWWSFHRRTNRDYEHKPENAETIVLATMSLLMLRRLA